MSRLLKLRSAPTLSVNRDLRIDRDNLVIHDVVAMQSGIEALGHGCMADTKTLEMTRDLGNAHRYGVRSRFGHPGMSENAAGKKVGVGRDFHVDGDKLRHQLHLLDAARESPVFARDPIEYLFDIAERYPEEMGESVVIEADILWPLADGREVGERGYGDDEDVEWGPDNRPVNALTPLPVLRPDKFYYVDVVNEGALTHDGLFGADVLAMMFSGTSNLYAQEVFDLMDRFREEYNIPLDTLPGKVDQVMSRYLHARGYKEPAMTVKKSLEEKLSISGTLTPPNPLGTSATASELPVETAAQAVVDDPLDAALASAEATQQRQAEPPEVPVEPQESDPDRIARLEEIVLAQQGQIDKLIRLSAMNTQNIQTCDENIRRVAAEPIETVRVPKTNGAMGALQALEGRGLMRMDRVPRPPASARTADIRHVDPRGAQTPDVDFDGDPTTATLLTHIGRQTPTS